MMTARQIDQAWVEMDRERKLAAANRLVAVEPGGCAPAVYVRDSIVAPDGSVPPISTDPNPFWLRGMSKDQWHEVLYGVSVSECTDPGHNHV